LEPLKTREISNSLFIAHCARLYFWQFADRVPKGHRCGMVPTRVALIFLRMAKLKHLLPPAALISVGGHLGVLMMGLVLVSARPSEAPAPEAMVVDIVPPDEAPRLQGTPADARTSGSQQQINGPGSAPQSSPPPKPPSQQSQKHSEEQKEASQKLTAPQAMRADLAFTERVKEEIEETKAEETPEQPNIAEEVARYALAGGALGGGFNAPAVNTNKAGYDYTAAFRERVSSCSSMPGGFSPDEKVSVAMRITFNRDGTLSAQPRTMEPIMTDRQQLLMESAISALERCQPYTMLPPDKYKHWKTLDVTIYPIPSLGN
jgi:hypothetical protein